MCINEEKTNSFGEYKIYLTKKEECVKVEFHSDNYDTFVFKRKS